MDFIFQDFQPTIILSYKPTSPEMIPESPSYSIDIVLPLSLV